MSLDDVVDTIIDKPNDDMASNEKGFIFFSYYDFNNI